MLFIRKLSFFILLMSFSTSGFSELLATGTVEKFHANKTGAFAFYLETTVGCSSRWFYALKSEMDIDGWRALQSLALVAYSQKKTISIFGAPTDCEAKRFSTIDTLN